MDTSRVTAAKPKSVNGAIFIAPVSTTLPTDAATELDAAFSSLGFVSEDGLSNTFSPSSEAIKAWGGEVVLTPTTERPDTFKFTLIESSYASVLKVVYGDSNVTTADGNIAVTASIEQLDPHAFVFDMAIKGGLKRIVVPYATVSSIGEVKYADGEAVGYEVEITAMPDSSGKTHYEYIEVG